MIDTNLEVYLPDLAEEVNLFSNGNELKIRHRFESKEGKFVNTVTVNGKTYAYGNLVKKAQNEIEEKRLIKRYAKLSLYKALVQFTGESNPWGSLTGVRPTKLAYSSIDESGEFKEFFTDVMKVGDKKTRLTEDVLNTQRGIYERNTGNCDFFVFIPFCPSRCKYCSFITQDLKSSAPLVDGYVSTLIREINESKGIFPKYRSIYVGGGTPVSLSDLNLDKILCALNGVNADSEFTVEAGRPDRITESNLRLMKEHNVTRVCINPQTFNDKTLEKIGRNHTSKEIFEKYDMAKKYFSVNMDLIAGLEGESFDDFKKSLDTAVKLSPDNITVHSLCIKRGSYLAEESESLTNGKEVEKMIDYAEETLSSARYNPYYLYRQKYMAGNLENVGYTKEGKACVYNVDTMEEIASCVACGANGISKKVNFNEDKIERYASPKDVKTYMGKIDKIVEEKRLLFDK